MFIKIFLFMPSLAYMDDKEIKFRKQLGARIQELRQDKELTQPQLAALIGFKDYQAISRIENGRVSPSIYIIYQISKALEVKIDDLCNFK
ncbi:helix-turn-helix domain-containing protein [Sphingobacterium sp. UBA3549]|uniref:helix-turn-helix domain-containing protein n=2 Tax=unclassified Sphingobacterium TaxID=2609468 RepID=UPI0025DB3D56|nr:helix-turn-helix transcriptional regulator [Sphingobacterium sp. UBA3549]